MKTNSNEKVKTKYEQYKACGRKIRWLLFALVLDFIAFLNIYWGHWYITFIVAILIGIGIALVIGTGIKKQILVCSECGKLIWSDHYVTCRTCGKELFEEQESEKNL